MNDLTVATAAFPGTVLITAPHMDDAALACGATIAGLPGESVHILYATDGSRSPIPMFLSQGEPSAELPEIRRAEALQAMALLGVPERNIHFLNFPDGRLRHSSAELRRALADYLGRLSPDHLLIPFRYDRHPDHLALNRALMDALPDQAARDKVVEYFVYYRWRLLSGGDLRNYIRPEQLIKIDSVGKAELKRRALDCFVSQTTLFFDWQRRPILPPERLEAVSAAPEYFLCYDERYSGARVFSRQRSWIRFAHRFEPAMKKIKDRMLNFANHRRKND